MTPASKNSGQLLKTDYMRNMTNHGPEGHDLKISRVNFFDNF